VRQPNYARWLQCRGLHAGPPGIAPGGVIGKRSDLFGQPSHRDRVDVLEGEASHGVEEEGEVAGGGHEGVDDVQCGDEVFVEELGVAGEATVQEDGVAVRVGIGAEAVAEAASGAGEDGGGELGGFSSLEKGGGGAPLLQALALAQDGPGAARVALDVPGAGDVGLAGGLGLITLGEIGEELGGEDVLGERVGRTGVTIFLGAHRGISCVRQGPGELPTHSGPLFVNQPDTLRPRETLSGKEPIRKAV
jgi:hypothetical protein